MSDPSCIERQELKIQPMLAFSFWLALGDMACDSPHLLNR